jgi:hypothetical protein
MADTSNLEKPRRFAAKYRYRWQGWVAILFGTSWILSGEVVALVLGIPLVFVGIYLLRGQGPSPKSIERSKKNAEILESKIDSATRDLESASGGKAVVAYRNLEKILKSTKLPDYSNRLDQIMKDINFDKSKLDSVHIGTISGFSSTEITHVEVFNDWIISGQKAYDVEPSTKGEVHIEGSVQVDAKGNQRDFRKAYILFASSSWSQTFPISASHAPEARRIVAQLSVVTDSLKPTGVTSADISRMIETILNNSGQPPAEKLKQLSDLRFQRLLSDTEFDAAKARILGI